MTNRTIQKSVFNGELFPWFICIIGMLFYCYNYFLRVSPSVMQTEITSTFHITATQFGALAGFYYYAYTPMQLPAGIIFDKFGARFVLFFACLMASLGLAIFISADSFALAGAGRFLIGLGTAFSYIGVLKLASVWLPPNRFATAAGVTTAVGMFCGALAQKYLTKLIELIGYKNALNLAVMVGLALSVLIVLVIKNRNSTPHANNEMQSPLTLKQLADAFKAICVNPQMWIIGAVGCLLYLPASIFLDLWGIPYLKAVYHLTAEQAVTISNIIFIGWIISGPIVGIISDKIQRRRMPLILSGVIAALLLCVIFYVPGLSYNMLYLIAFSIGFCCGSHSLCFALSKENSSELTAGTAVAITNMLIMAGGAIFQPVVGKLLDMHATHLGWDGLPVYSSSDYTFALSIIPIGVAVGIFLSTFLKETYCQSYEEQLKAETEDEVGVVAVTN